MAWQPDYCTDSDLKAYVRVADTVDDTQIALAITTASRSVDKHCNRQFGRTLPETRYYTTRADWVRGVYVVDLDDLLSDSITVTLDGTATTDYDLEPVNASQEGKPWTRLTLTLSATSVAVSGMWGWSSVPVAVKQATILQASRLLNRRDTPTAIVPDAGLRMLARLDPDVQVSLAGYVRRRRVG